MTHPRSILTALALFLVPAVPAFAERGTGPVKTILMQDKELPVTAFNVTFRVGSADDPKGSEGIARLTAMLLREGGVKAWGTAPARSRAEIEELLYPMAAELGVSIHKEQTSFQTMVAAADADAAFDLVAQMLLAPAFNEGEFERLKSETLDALTKRWPREDQEELGKAALDRAIWGAGHPYAHVAAGTVAGVRGITLDAVKAFYAANFTRNRVTIGIAGVIPKGLSARAERAFGTLPRGKRSLAAIPEAPKSAALKLTIVKGPFEATGVHLGQAIAVTRGSADYPPLYLTANAFGKHRSFVGRLMRVVREVRGLNYGTYAYVEDFPNGGRSLIEPTQAARSRQAFTMWGRPTTLENGCFLLRQMLSEARHLAKEGLTRGEFELGRSHLLGYVPLLATGVQRRLGYAIDAQFYQTPSDYLAQLRRKLEAVQPARVKAVIRKHIKPDQMHLVVVTPDPEKFKSEILSESCAVTYPAGVTKPAEVMAEDLLLAKTAMGLTADRIEVVDAEALFAK